MPSIARSALSLVAASVLAAGCVGDPHVESDELEPAESAARAVTEQDFVGRWRFVYDDARRSAVESELASKISDKAELAAAKNEAAAEAAASEIEFTEDGEYISRVGGKVVLRARISEAPPGVTRTLRDEDTLVMTDPRKGDLVFERVAR